MASRDVRWVAARWMTTRSAPISSADIAASRGPQWCSDSGKGHWLARWRSSQLFIWRERSLLERSSNSSMKTLGCFSAGGNRARHSIAVSMCPSKALLDSGFCPSEVIRVAVSLSALSRSTGAVPSTLSRWRMRVVSTAHGTASSMRDAAGEKVGDMGSP